MLDDKETWYLYFDAEDYELIRRKFPELHKLEESERILILLIRY